MSRRSKPERRIPAADPIYNSVDVSKFINRILRRGKKSLAERIFYSTITKIEEKITAQINKVYCFNSIPKTSSISQTPISHATTHTKIPIPNKITESFNTSFPKELKSLSKKCCFIFVIYGFMKYVPHKVITVAGIIMMLKTAPILSS